MGLGGTWVNVHNSYARSTSWIRPENIKGDRHRLKETEKYTTRFIERFNGYKMTVVFLIAAIGVLIAGFPYSNIWTFISGILLWLLAVANAKINELCKSNFSYPK
jgi:hypothetical protein